MYKLEGLFGSVTSINDLWSRFRNKLQEAIEKYIPCSV